MKLLSIVPFLGLPWIPFHHHALPDGFGSPFACRYRLLRVPGTALPIRFVLRDGLSKGKKTDADDDTGGHGPDRTLRLRLLPAVGTPIAFADGVKPVHTLMTGDMLCAGLRAWVAETVVATIAQALSPNPRPRSLAAPHRG